MSTYTITLNETEELALSTAAMSNEDWIQNAIHERCRIAIEEISKIAIEKCLELDMQVPSSKNDMVALAFTQGWVESLQQKTTNLTNMLMQSQPE